MALHCHHLKGAFLPLASSHGEECALSFLLLTISWYIGYGLCMERTVIVHLNPTPEQAHSLKATLEQYTACFNAVAKVGFTTDCSNGVELHKRTYYPLRAEYPDLPAQLVCSAHVKATEAVTSALTWKVKKEKAYPKRVEQARKQGKPAPVFKPVRCPHSDMVSIRYDQQGTGEAPALHPYRKLSRKQEVSQ